jgi:hypothetical protein
MHRIQLALVVASLGVAATADAGGKKAKVQTQVQFVGVHPIAKDHGGGLCHIELPHVHVYEPAHAKVQYRVHDDAYFFVGDPVAYGWEGDKHTYYGHHPIDVDVVVGGHDHTEYCYLDGAHFHAYAPPPEVSFEVRAGAYWYVGDVPEVYVEGRKTYDAIDVVYEPIAYERPVVVVETPPPKWIGVTVHAHVPAVVVDAPAVVVEAPRARAHGDVHAGVEVVAPSLEIEVAVPTLHVDIGGHAHGGVVVHDHHRHGKKKWKHKKHGHKKKHGRRGRLKKRWH